MASVLRRNTRALYAQEEKPREDTARREPFTNHGERYEEKPNLPTP